MSGPGEALGDMESPGRVSSLNLWRVLKVFTNKMTFRLNSEYSKESR